MGSSLAIRHPSRSLRRKSCLIETYLALSPLGFCFLFTSPHCAITGFCSFYLHLLDKAERMVHTLKKQNNKTFLSKIP